MSDSYAIWPRCSATRKPERCRFFNHRPRGHHGRVLVKRTRYSHVVSNAKLFIAFTNAVEGRSDEFNAWYDNTHVQDVLSIPGFKSVQRFKATAAQRPRDEPPFEYL